MRHQQLTIVAIATAAILLGAACGGGETRQDDAPTETFQDAPQKPVDGDAPESETEAALPDARARLEAVRIKLERAEESIDEMPEEEQLTYREKLEVLNERRMNVVKSLDQIEAQEAGPEPEREVFPIDAQKELEQLEVDVSRFDVEVRGVESG